MGFDIRIPIGALLAGIGALLFLYGAFATPAVTARTLGISIDLWWGLTMLVVGLGFLGVAWRRR